MQAFVVFSMGSVAKFFLLSFFSCGFLEQLVATKEPEAHRSPILVGVFSLAADGS
jgi:hypothetical protein